MLNVPAKRMSAFADAPDDFVRWLAERHPRFSPDSFVPRLIYGEYVRDLLDVARASGRLTVVAGEAVSLTQAGGVAIVLANGGEIAADRAVLAVGNLPPQHPRGFDDQLPANLYAADPWTPAATAGLGDEDVVLFLGTGLTMIDMALRLQDEGFGGRMIALSRRGLLPHRHGPHEDFVAIEAAPEAPASTLLKSVRSRADAVGWRNAVDELRPFTQPLWGAAEIPTRKRFLRHLRPWWDIHRHRIAPQVADRIAGLIDSGRLAFVSGGTRSTQAEGERLSVTYKPRGEGGEATMTVRRAINCTGPQSDLRTASDPLLWQLTSDGVIRPDPLAIGIDVDEGLHTVAADGLPNERLYAVGPMTKGALWEIVAVPDIRGQVANLAERLASR